MMSLIIKFGESLDVVLGTNQPKSLESVLHWNNARLFFRRMLVMLGLPIALSLSLAISQWVRKDSFFHHLFDLKSVGPYFAWCLALIIDVLVYFFVYFFVPRKKVPGLEALKAAWLAAVLSELTRYLFGVYNSYAVSVHKIYGVLSVIPMFILWVQVAWMVILISAMVIVLPSKKSRA
jgi:membrane protein